MAWSSGQHSTAQGWRVRISVLPLFSTLKSNLNLNININRAGARRGEMMAMAKKRGKNRQSNQEWLRERLFGFELAIRLNGQRRLQERHGEKNCNCNRYIMYLCKQRNIVITTIRSRLHKKTYFK